MSGFEADAELQGPAFTEITMTTARTALALAVALIALPMGAEPQGYLGIRLKKLDSASDCLRIEHVLPGGSADRSGVVPGDIIAMFNGVEINCSTLATTDRPLPHMKVGEQASLSILRDGKRLEIKVKAEAPPPGLTAMQEQAQEREVKMEAGEALRQRLIRTKEVFTIVMEESGEFRFEGPFSPEEAELLHWYYYEIMAGPQMRKLFKPGRHELYLTFDRARNAYIYETANPPKP